MNQAFGNLKREKILNVFNCALEQVRTTRTEISDITDLSYVTVSKACDALIDLDILNQSFTKDKSAQRRSRILSVKLRYWIGVYVFLPGSFTFNICDLSLRCVYSHKYTPMCDADPFLDDQIKQFLISSVNFVKDKVKAEYCCGIGILVPGDYDEEKDSVPRTTIRHFSSIKIKEVFKDYTFNKEPIIYSVYSAYARFVSGSAPQDERILCLFLNKEHLNCIYVQGGNDYDMKLMDFGNLTPLGKPTMQKLSKSPPDPDLFFSKLADIIFTLINTVGVTQITVSGSLYSQNDIVAIVLSDNISLICNDHFMIPPQVIAADVRIDSARFISREIRHDWFLRDILKEDSP